MKTHNTWSTTIRLAALMAGTLIACAVNASEIVENQSYSGAKTTIRYAMWGGANEVTYAKEICNVFVQRHPEIRIDVSVYPWGQYWAKMQTQIASGLAPDVMSFYSGSFGVWVDRGALLPLDDIAKESGLNLKDYHQAAVDNCTWNGKLYAMPMEIPVWTVVYSKDRFEESGIPESEWPKADKAMTWDEFRALAKRLTLRKADGTYTQYGFAATANWDLVMMTMYGGWMTDSQVNPTRSTVKGNEELAKGMIKVFQEQYGDRTTLGKVPISASGAVGEDTLLQSPRFAMYVTGPWALSQLKEAGVRFGLSPMPQTGKTVQQINVNSVGINATSKHRQEAWEFIKFMASKEVQVIYGRQLKGVPALKEARDSLIHNQFGIEGCEAYLHDLPTAAPSMTPATSYPASARDNWMSRLGQKLDKEYDERLAALKRVNGAIPPEEFKKFVSGMNDYVEKTIRTELPGLDRELQAGFDMGKKKVGGPLEKTVLPIVFLVIVGGFLFAYIKWVRKQGTTMPAGARKNNLAGFLFISPWMFGVTFFVVGPIIAAVALSFCNWNMVTPPEWIGVQNYIGLPGNEKFMIGLLTTLKYAALVIPISLAGGLFTAALLTCKIKGADAFKAILYFPALFTGAEAAVLWVNILNKEHGILNHFLSWFGRAPVNWTDETHAFGSVIFMNVFWIGGAMIIYYAGMKQVPAVLYEAAEIDGAGPFRKFFSVTIPMLSPVILFMVVMTTIGAFQVFTPALFFAGDSTTVGQPGDSLRFYAVNVYDEAFNNLKMGSACCYAIILFLLIFLITMLQMKLSKRFVHTEGA